MLGSYLHAAPAVVEDGDVQPLTQQLAEFINDPLHDPSVSRAATYRLRATAFPRWMRPLRIVRETRAAAAAQASPPHISFSNPPTPTRRTIFRHRRPSSPIRAELLITCRTWRCCPGIPALAKDLGSTYSFPDAQALTELRQAMPGTRSARRRPPAPPNPTVAAFPASGSPNGHQLIGYWAGYGRAGPTFPLREVSPQWDVIIVAFATPDKNAPEGTMQFHTPAGLDTEQFKADIAYLKSQGKKVMISLGGGGQHFTLADPKRVPNFVSSVTRIVTDYGFDGIDIDFESPSLSIDPGDTDFKHPTTPSIVNLISALRQLHDHFGPSFMISLVPEGTQIPSGYPSYGGQFGSYLADHLCHPRHPLLHRCAGLQHAAARRSRWRDLPARHGGLSRRHDRTSAARLQRRRRSQAVLSADAAR